MKMDADTERLVVRVVRARARMNERKMRALSATEPHIKAQMWRGWRQAVAAFWTARDALRARGIVVGA